MRPIKVDPALRAWATAVQAEYIDAVIEHGSAEQAAKALGVHPSGVLRCIRRAQRNAALRGWSPEHQMTHPVPDTHVARGISTYYDADGKVRGQWVKSTLDDERAAEVKRAALEALAEELPRLPPLPAPGHAMAELCNVYTMTDCHMGMLAWHKEGGADWDLKIAEHVLSGCFEHMLMGAPAAETAVVAQLGDFLHTNGFLPLTPRGGHVLDAAARFPQIVQAAVRVLRRMVDQALARHKRVIVLMADANHDPEAAVWLRAMFGALYEREPRVQVLDSELPYYCYQHGKTMLAWHHGNLKKNDQLPLLFAAQYPKVWGATTKRYCHTGHRHHVEEKEHSGMTVIQHPTLAARDAYAARGGWISERQATAITYHVEHGQVARNTVNPNMLVKTR